MVKRVTLWLAIASVATIAIAPAAGADTFCVYRVGCEDPGHNFTTIQGAIAAADANNPSTPPASPDLILVGDGIFHEAVSEGSDNPVDIVGSGPRTESGGTLIERDPGSNVKTVALSTALGGRASTVQDLSVQVASGNNNIGLQMTGDIGNVEVIAATTPSPPTNSVGISVNGNGATVISGAVIDLPGTSVGVRSHLAHLESSSVTAKTGVQGDGTIHASTIDANLGAQPSELKFEDCVMHISGPNGVAFSVIGSGFQTHNRLKARHVTLIGDSDPTSLAVLSEGVGSASSPNSAEVDIRSSIIRGFATNFKRSSTNDPGGNAGTADLTVAYSDYDDSLPVEDNGGDGTFDDTTGNTSADPDFRSAADLRLSPGSALIDAGDPASPDESGFQPDSPLDFDGHPRKVDGNGDGIARADIGAFEFIPPPPPGQTQQPPQPSTVRDVFPPRIALRGKRVQRGAQLVKVTVSSDETAELTGTGTIAIPVAKPGKSSTSAARKKRFKLRPQAKPIAAGGTTTLTLRLNKRARKLTKRAQARHKTAKVTITVQATDAAGNAASAKLKVKLKRKKR